MDPTAYALQMNSKGYYKILWSLNLTGKIKIMLYRCAWNYLPTIANLNYKTLTQNATSPRYGGVEETINHIF